MTEDKPFGSRYLLGPVIGRGAMGRVHRARVRDGDEDVAIKVLRDDLASQPDLVARFLQESQVLRSISHPNLVSVRDLVVESDQLGIVMDLVEGGDLRRQGAPAPADRAVRLLAQVADGLAAVHANGVVHRDVKPENVLVELRDGQDPLLRLTDFGVARIVGRSFTRVSSLIGSPDYLSPEAATGREITSAADVYALGVVLYELLTGQPPFEAESPYALMKMHEEVTPDRPEGMPDDLWTLLAAMLAKAAEVRPGAAEVGDRLRALADPLVGLGPFPKPLQGTILTTRAHGPAGTPGSVVVGAPTGGLVGERGGGTQLTSRAAARVATGELDDFPTLAEPPAPRRRRTLLLAGAASVVALVGGLFIAGGGDEPQAVRSGPEPVIEHAFAPIAYEGGVVMTRVWTLEDETTLSAELVLTNSGESSVQGEHIEVVPKSVARHVDDLTFEPEPSRIIDPDPVVAFNLSAIKGGDDLEIRYQAQLEPGEHSEERLAELVQDQIDAQSAYEAVHGEPEQITLATLTITPASAEVPVGGSVLMTLSGSMSDGSPASAEVLAGVVWSSSDPAVASAGPSVTGVGPGTATVRAEAGIVYADALVTVLPSGGELAAEPIPSTLAPTSGAGPAPTTTVRPTGSNLTTTTTRPTTTTTRPTTTTTRPTTTTTRPTTTTTKATTTTTRPTTTTAPPPPPTISLSRGGPVNGGYWYAVSLSNFGAGQAITLTCRDSFDPGGFYSQTVTTNGAGQWSSGSLCWSADGPDHWVTGGGRESNHVGW